MKEAAGEANLTVIAIVLIGIVMAIAYPLITSLMEGAAKRSCCTNAGKQWVNNACEDPGTWNSTTKSCN